MQQHIPRLTMLCQVSVCTRNRHLQVFICLTYKLPPCFLFTFNFPASVMNTRARRRWVLLYTLLKNPPLILLRKHNLKSAQTETTVRAWVMASQTQSRQSPPQAPPEIIITPEEDC